MNLSEKDNKIWDKAKKCNCGADPQDGSADHKLCGICGGTMDYGAHESVLNQRNSRGAWNIDHIIAKSRGGSDSIENLQAVHITCNRNKGNN